MKDLPPPPVAASESAGSSPRFVRTLLGDLASTDDLGVCDAHEHVMMRGPWLAAHFPEFVLDDVERAVVDLRAFRAAGGGWIVDSMPAGAGRDAALLAQAALASGVPIVCPTGIHQTKYYPADHPLLSLDRERLAELFVREIELGIDDGGGRLDLRAGVIKVASGGERLTNWERELFAAAACAQRESGCPILTHTEAGREAFEQVTWLCTHGASPSQIVLSHCDKHLDLSYHRDLLAMGVSLEYDQHFRQLRRGERCASVDLLCALVDEFPNQLLIGMDMARQSYWQGYGGEPGLVWLVNDLLPRMHAAGLTERQVRQVSRENPWQAYAFRSTTSGTAHSRF